MEWPTPGPVTYAQWSECLDRFATGLEDEAVLVLMSRGTAPWTGGAGPLFAQRLAEVFNARLTICSERLTRDLRTSSDEGTVVRAVVNARQSLSLLHRLSTLASLPDTLRAHLSSEVRAFAERSQKSLEDSARADRSGRLALVLRNNNLLRYELAEPAAAGNPTPIAPAAQAQPQQPAASPRRRNILS